MSQISIIMPVYNGESYLRRAVDSDACRYGMAAVVDPFFSILAR